jgi:hypothetical protein
MNLYTVVTGKIMEGDLTDQWDFDEERSVLAPVPKEMIGLNTDDVRCVILRPVKVPSLDETNDARLKLCRDISICDASDCCSDCMYKTMLRLMGLEPEQAKE